MQFIRNIRFEIKYIFEEIGMRIKHPTRPGDFIYHCWKLYDHVIGHPWYCLKRGVRNLVVWFPTIWGNDCWDHNFMTSMMDKQMKEMETLWEKTYVPREREWNSKEDEEGNPYGWRCQHRRVWKRIRWTRKLYAMYRDEHYAMKWYDIHHNKFPHERFESNPCKWDEWGEPILFQSKPMPEDEREHYRAGSDKAQKMDEKVFKLYMKNLGTLRSWWD